MLGAKPCFTLALALDLPDDTSREETPRADIEYRDPHSIITRDFHSSVVNSYTYEDDADYTAAAFIRRTSTQCPVTNMVPFFRNRRCHLVQESKTF